MTALRHTLTDTRTMLGRNLTRSLRSGYYIYMVGFPIVILLLFVYVFGGTLGAGISGDMSEGGGTAAYLEYVVPGIILFAIASGPQLTAISVSQDMTERIVARFRTMNISRSAVLAGHVLGNGIQQLLGVVLVVLLAVILGYRTGADLLGWLAATGVVALLILAFSWFAVALGTVARNVESASNLPMPLMLLPFLGSAFVPTESMPAVLRRFAEFQPFTPFTETVRALLTGGEPGASLWISLAWCAAIGIGGYVWARVQYERRSLRA